MKRIIKLTESDLTRIVRRVLREQDEIKTLPEVNITENLFKDLEGKTASFYLENEKNIPILPQVRIDDVKIDKDVLIIDGTNANIGKLQLTYRCGNPNDFFNLKDIKFDGKFLQDVNDFLSSAKDTLFQTKSWWRKLLTGHVKNYVRQENSKEVNQKLKELLNANKNPIVYPPVESNSDNKYFMSIVKKKFCSLGGRTKADFASTGGRQGSDMV